MKLWRKLNALLRRKELDVDMAAEVRLHIEHRTRENIAAGMSADDARRAAQRAFGNVGLIQDSARDQRGVRWLEDLGQDLYYGVRSLGKNPGFTSFALLTLALGI